MPLPAAMSWPTSVSRAVMVPANGRGDAREGLQFLEPAHIGARGLDGRGLELEVGLLLGGFLLADAGGLEQFGPAGGGDLGQRQRGFGLGELGAGAGAVPGSAPACRSPPATRRP